MIPKTALFRRCAHALWMALLLMLGCETSPTGRSQLILVSDGEMNQMGDTAFSQITQEEKLCFDDNLQGGLDTIGARVLAAAELDEEGYQFRLFDNEQINAFALPGGNVGIFTGILPVAETNAGLAAIVGHEIAHVVAEHGAERVSQSLVAELGLSILDGILLRGSDYRELALAALGLGTQVGVLLPYSREHESEADRIGLKWMAEAGYDPRAAVRLWERMAQQSAGVPEFLSTHPDPMGRADELRAQLPEALELYEASDKVPTQPLANEDGQPITEAAPRCDGPDA